MLGDVVPEPRVSAQQILEVCDRLPDVFGVGCTVGADGQSGLVDDEHGLMAEVDGGDPVSQPVHGLRAGTGSRLVLADGTGGGGSGRELLCVGGGAGPCSLICPT